MKWVLVGFVLMFFLLVGYVNAQVTIDVYTDQSLGEINPLIYGSNVQWAWNGDGVFNVDSDQVDQSRIDLAIVIKNSLIRFPGGTTSNFYHWPDGIGSREDRPEKMPWKNNVTHKHYFGTDEFIDFVERIESEAIITVSCQNKTYDGTDDQRGTAKEAAAWVAYTNGVVGDNRVIGVDEYGYDWKTVDYWASQRVQNCLSLFGNKTPESCVQPYNVKYWEIGNEHHVTIQTDEAFDVEYYAQVLNDFSAEMKRIDPSIEIVAVGHKYSHGYGSSNNWRDRTEWNMYLLENAGDSFEYLAPHVYYDEDFKTNDYATYLAGPTDYSNIIQEHRQVIQQYKPTEKDIKLMITEYNTQFGTDDYRKKINVASLGSALYVADMLRVFIENQDVVDAANILETHHEQEAMA